MPRRFESLDSYKFEEELLNPNRMNVKVELGEYEGQPITIVKYNRIVEKADDGLCEFWLSPAQGNHPIYFTGHCTLRNEAKTRLARRLFVA